MHSFRFIGLEGSFKVSSSLKLPKCKMNFNEGGTIFFYSLQTRCCRIYSFVLEKNTETLEINLESEEECKKSQKGYMRML